MMVIRGKVHKYLGMTLDYTVCGQVEITMIKFLDKILIAFEKGGTQWGRHKDKCSTGEYL